MIAWCTANASPPCLAEPAGAGWYARVCRPRFVRPRAGAARVRLGTRAEGKQKCAASESRSPRQSRPNLRGCSRSSMASRCTTAAVLLAVAEESGPAHGVVHVSLNVHGEQGEAASGLAVREALVAVVLGPAVVVAQEVPEAPVSGHRARRGCPSGRRRHVHRTSLAAGVAPAPEPQIQKCRCDAGDVLPWALTSQKRLFI
jgi:hypothetical protein